MIDLANQLFLTDEKMQANKFIKAVLKKYDYCTKIIKKHFNKILVRPVEDEGRFQSIK